MSRVQMHSGGLQLACITSISLLILLVAFKKTPCLAIEAQFEHQTGQYLGSQRLNGQNVLLFSIPHPSSPQFRAMNQRVTVGSPQVTLANGQSEDQIESRGPMVQAVRQNDVMPAHTHETRGYVLVEPELSAIEARAPVIEQQEPHIQLELRPQIHPQLQTQTRQVQQVWSQPLEPASTFYERSLRPLSRSTNEAQQLYLLPQQQGQNPPHISLSRSYRSQPEESQTSSDITNLLIKLAGSSPAALNQLRSFLRGSNKGQFQRPSLGDPNSPHGMPSSYTAQDVHSSVNSDGGVLGNILTSHNLSSHDEIKIPLVVIAMPRILSMRRNHIAGSSNNSSLLAGNGVSQQSPAPLANAIKETLMRLVRSNNTSRPSNETSATIVRSLLTSVESSTYAPVHSVAPYARHFTPLSPLATDQAKVQPQLVATVSERALRAYPISQMPFSSGGARSILLESSSVESNPSPMQFGSSGPSELDLTGPRFSMITQGNYTSTNQTAQRSNYDTEPVRELDAETVQEQNYQIGQSQYQQSYQRPQQGMNNYSSLYYATMPSEGTGWRPYKPYTFNETASEGSSLPQRPYITTNEYQFGDSDEPASQSNSHSRIYEESRQRRESNNNSTGIIMDLLKSTITSARRNQHLSSRVDSSSVSSVSQSRNGDQSKVVLMIV